MRKFIIFYLLIGILGCGFNFLYGTTPKDEKKDDEFLEFIYKKTKNSIKDKVLFKLGQNHWKLGFSERAMEYYDLLISNDIKRIFLLYLFDTPTLLEEKQLNIIKDRLNSYEFEDDGEKLHLYIKLFNRYLKIKSNANTSEIYKICKGTIREILKDLEDESDYWFYDIAEFYVLLCNTEFKKESERFLSNPDLLTSEMKMKFDRIEIYSRLLTSLIFNGNTKMALNLATEINNKLDVKDLTHRDCNTLLYDFVILRQFGYASNLTEKIVKKYGIENFKDESSSPFIDALANLFSNNPDLKSQVINEFESLGDFGIRMLIEMNEWQKALEMARVCDTKTGNTKLQDLFYSYLGKKYNTNYRIMFKEAAFNIALEIKDYYKKIELMIEIARSLIKNQDNEFILKIMDEILLITKGNDTWSPTQKTFISLLLAEFGFTERAMELINKTQDSYEHSLKLFYLGEYYILNGNYVDAKELLSRFKYKSVFQGMLLSKVAAYEYCSGNEEKAMQLFKDSFLILKNNEEGKFSGIPGLGEYSEYLSYILDDYVNARLYRKVTESGINIFAVNDRM